MRAIEPRRLITAFAAALVAMLATALPAGAATHHRTRPRHHQTHRSHSAIPQHNGGDHDSDNNGGPSDGDGDV